MMENANRRRDRLTRQAGTVTPTKIVAGKARCDWCRRAAVPIRECACKATQGSGPGSVLWYDLCSDCIARDAPLESKAHARRMRGKGPLATR